MRHQQLQTVSSANTATSTAEKTASLHLTISLSSLAIATTGALFYPPFTWLSVPGIIYIFIPRFKEVLRAIFIERKIKMVIVDGSIIMGLLLSGQVFACALTSTFMMLSRKLLVKVEDHSLGNVISLFGKKTDFVWLLTDGVEVRVPFDTLQVSDIIVVHAGEIIPVDGTISDGAASVDQRILTGEAQPAEKSVGEPVLASTVVLSGQIHIQVEKAGSDTVTAQITEILNRTTDFKQHIQWEWQEWLDKTAWVTLLSSAISLPVLGPTGALTVLYAVNFGCSMRIIAPLTLLNFVNLTSQNSILIKDGRALESLQQVDTVVFDKTGTLTCEEPTLAKIHSLDTYSEETLLTYAAAAEYKQTHPIALAILTEVRQRQLVWPDIEEATYEIGYGLKVRINDQLIRVGSMRFMEMEKMTVSARVRQIQEHSHESGHSLICVAIDDRVEGAIELAPTIRPEARQITQHLRERGMSLVIISGDHARPTQKLAQELGIEHYFAETLPENKATLISELQQEGKSVCFIGDGINDSIALKQANLSISLSGATTVAMDAAQIVFMDGSLKQLDRLFDISHDFDRNMQTSFMVSTIPTILSISGIFLLHMSFIATLFLYYSGLVIGIGNSMQPLIRQQRTEHKTILNTGHTSDE
ncbi:MAG: heavy metal translocating P-type ATPase [Pseudomonadota bacterium]